MALSCLFEICVLICRPVQEALQGFLGTGANAFLSPLWDREEAIGDRTVLWGNRIQRLRTSTASILGREELLSEIHRLLSGDKEIICLYGMGGVGKTALLAQINNQLFDSRDRSFDVVIWVTVSKDVDILKIQEDIGVRLGFSRPGENKGRQLPSDEPDRGDTLYKALFGKKFLLLLDDMWEPLKLEDVGVPRPGGGNLNRGKIVFTTRSWDVCVGMDADAKLRVGCLDETESWELFCSKVGDYVDLNNHPVIRPLAQSVVEKCGGVPLALITVGRAMSGETSIRGWKNAMLSLSESPNSITGMEDKVLSILKYSFDRLQDESAKQCLLYCSLFPEDADIDVDKLVGLWTGEGFLDSEYGNHTTLDQARFKGDTIIRTLQNACFLEDRGSTCVRLHGLVRGMALWLTNKTNKTIVLGGDQKRLGGSAEVERWPDAVRISIDVRDPSDELPCPERECPELITFLVFCNSSWRFSGLQNFMESMQALRVLDLSGANLEKLPSEIGLLVELRHLNLEWTSIRSLPKELGKLVKLQQLNLSNMHFLLQIPRESLVTLESLQSLDLYNSDYHMTWQGDDVNGDRVGICLRDLESNLGLLEELSVTISTSQCLQNLADSKKFQRCTIKLGLEKVPDLKVNGVRQLRYLKELNITNCSQLKDISCIRQLCYLEVISVWYCGEILELLAEPVGDEPGHGDPDRQHVNFPSFSSLRKMSLSSLPALTSIAKGTLLFPSLELLDVEKCPLLKRLPLGLDSGEKIRQIIGEQGWCDALDWDDISVRQKFQPCFIPRERE